MKGGTTLKLFTIVSYFLIQNAETASRIDPLVDTKVGLIRGLRANDGEYAMFMGIPYATVDSANPFGPSTPHPGFDDVFDAYDDSAICPQIEQPRSAPVGSLDCLHLNIYVPNTASSRNPLPVLVWIHGGGFVEGYAGRDLYGPSYLVRHDVILVTLNYRVGPYGFMCLDDPEVSGNQGLKDQKLALRWIRDNIKPFGGDVDQITLFGESAGGASVDLHLLYNDDQIFNKLISQSGTALCPWAVPESDQSAPLKLAEHLGFESTDVKQALSFLSTVDPSLVIAATAKLDMIFRPCVEKQFDNVDRFIREHPVTAAIPELSEIPILIGYNDDEGFLFVLLEHITSMENLVYDNFVEYFNFNSDDLNEMEQLVRHFYFGDEEINEHSVRAAIDFYSDFTFDHPVSRSIYKYLDNGAKSIFHYVFSYTGTANFYPETPVNIPRGATHADELNYLFNAANIQVELTLEDKNTIDRLTTLWTNFAKYGNPTPETSELLPVTWSPLTENAFNYLSIGSEVSMQQRPFQDRMAFWDLFYKLNEKAQKGYHDSE